MRIYIFETKNGNDYKTIIDTDTVEINHYGDTISFIYKNEWNQLKCDVFNVEKIWDINICNLKEKKC